MQRSLKPAVFSAALLSLAFASACRAAPVYSVQNLGSLGGPFNYAHGLNTSGQVTGGASASASLPNQHTFVYSSGQLTDLGGSFAFSQGNSINASGQIAGTSDSLVPGAYGVTQHAFVYGNGSSRDLGTLGGENSYGNGINDRGWVTGVSDAIDPATGNPIRRAFLDSGGGMVDLGTLGDAYGGAWSEGRAINASGQVTGASDTTNALGYHAFIAGAGGMTDLGTLGSSVSVGNALNDHGEVTGYSYVGGSNSAHAFVYRNGQMSDLDSMASYFDSFAYDYNSYGYGINNAGLVVGSYSYRYNADNAVQMNAFVTVDGLITDLNLLLDPAVGYLNLISADGINDRGQIIAAGYDTAGAAQMFLLTPDQAVPEPGSLWLVIPGLLAAYMARRRTALRLRLRLRLRVRRTALHARRAALCWLLPMVLLPALPPARAQGTGPVDALPARVVAVGIPGAGAVAAVGFFHPGGPIRDNARFAAHTQAGRILEAQRVLVASRSNFGAPRALATAAEGAVLSLDPSGPTLVVPPGFAAAGGQAQAAEGRVQLFAAQSPAFVNGLRTPGASSADQPTVSNPLGISINNAFGRLWFANAPAGAYGPGTESIADPTGEPLANAPSKLLGGVFASGLTNRPQQLVPGGLAAGAVATAFLGMSPDGSKRAVFAVLTADGALAQLHTEFALDGLAPAGTVAAVPLPQPDDPAADQARVTRAGMLLNWAPDRVLFVTEPARNRIAVLRLSTDDQVFRLKDARHLASPTFDVPIDIAPAIPEVANPGFSSNTMLAGNADLYVANRGNGTVVRMRQDGSIVAVRRVMLPDGGGLGLARLNGIAVSPDAQRIWVTLSGAIAAYPDAPGVLLELPAFGAATAPLAQDAQAAAAVQAAQATPLQAQGEQLFKTVFTPEQGLGPLYIARACQDCHARPGIGGTAADGLGVVRRVGRMDGQGYNALPDQGGPIAREHSVAELGVACTLHAGPPAAANLISVRIATPLYGLGLIDAISDDTLLAGAAAQRGGVNGVPNRVRDEQGRERIGRYGWKADTATLAQSVAGAFRNIMGITSPLAPTDGAVPEAGDCGQSAAAVTPDNDGRWIHAVAAFVAALAPLPAAPSTRHIPGQILFAASGCAACHTPSLPAAGTQVPLYSDLLLHDMGPALADGVVQGQAGSAHWRTAALWGLASRARFLHDGRALDAREAVLLHGGDGEASARAFRRLTAPEQAQLMGFVAAL